MCVVGCEREADALSVVEVSQADALRGLSPVEEVVGLGTGEVEANAPQVQAELTFDELTLRGEHSTEAPRHISMTGGCSRSTLGWWHAGRCSST